MKIVINKCYGGFSISEAAVKRYAELKGFNVYPEVSSWGHNTFWTAPKDDPRRAMILEGEAFYNASYEDRIKSNELYEELVLDIREYERNDPTLIQVVEELGKDADGDCAELKIVEIPDDVEWEIEEYDGAEHIAELHRTWG